MTKLNFSGYAQRDSVKELNVIEIISTKFKLAETGIKTQSIDSFILSQNKQSNLAEVLSLNSGIYIKQYSPGGIATTAFRGANASQSAVLWNGFNINSPMLGQTNLALIPAFLFNDIKIQYGSQSALWGSGAMGGSLQLNTLPFWQKGLNVSLYGGLASYNSKSLGTALNWSKKNIAISAKMFGLKNQNNFNYFDSTQNKINQSKHSSFDRLGFVGDLRWILSKYISISSGIFGLVGNTQVPNYFSSLPSRQYQNDGQWRAYATCNLSKNKLNSFLRLAMLFDNLNYTDSTALIYSKSSSKIVLIENENFYLLTPRLKWHSGINFSQSSALSSGYIGEKYLLRYTALNGLNYKFKNEKLLIYGVVRVDYYSVGSTPITGNIAADYSLKDFKFKLNFAKIYRQPTLNEMYWSPGGQPNLKPEDGGSVEGEAMYEKTINKLTFYISGACYARLVNNWIMWLPHQGYSSPQNIQQVFSRGTETQLKIKYKLQRITFEGNIQTSYCLSTVESNYNSDNSSIGRQLIYTPRYNGSATFRVLYKNIGIAYYQTYTGYRFISADDSQWLNPYFYSSLRLNSSIKFYTYECSLYAAINNISNVNYNTIAGRPMPLRNFELGITINFNNNKQI
ncbi:MAG: TonB-dependent receptor [Bacteroidetes bacterium]|nr:TonB-dependent receptor [Bacteroidota bacterium]